MAAPSSPRRPSLTRIAIYTRISTDEEHQPYSLEAQDQRLHAYIQSQESWELTCQFSDQMTGTTLERPGLQRALRAARMHRFDLLLVYRVDRLSRSVRGLAQILEDLDHATITFRSATEPFDTGSPAGRMMVQMLGVFAEFERSTIVDRVIAGMERKAIRGGWNGGAVPIGYRFNRETGFLEVEPDEADLIPLVFDLYVNERLGSRVIASQLNDQDHTIGLRRGASPRVARPWSYPAVLTVLRNRVYLGEVFFRGTWHVAPHPPLIDQGTFDAAQVILDERGEDLAKRRTNPSDYLLGGLIRCESCGHHMVGTAAQGNAYRYRYYTCYRRQKYGTASCPTERINADILDQEVFDALLDVYGDQDLVDQAVAGFLEELESSRPQRQAELAEIAAESKEIEESLDRYFNAFESRAMSEATCGSRVEALGERLRALQARQAELAASEEPVLTGPTPAELAEIRAMIRDAREGTLARRKGLLQQFVIDVRVNGRDSIHPVFRVPLSPEAVPGEGAKVRELFRLVRLAGVEPAASCSAGMRSVR